MRPEDLLGYVRDATAVTIIIGAGASKAANIPMAGELVTRINDQFGHCLKQLSDEERKDYGKVMGALSPADRKAFIEPLLDEARISWGQIALASLIKNGNVRRILTFNFDLVLERAASITGQHLPVYDFGVAPTGEIARLAEPALFHLHGQSYGLRLLNTDKETEAHKKSIGPLLTDSLRNHVVIVGGYSGQNDAAFQVMEEAYNDQNYLFWLGYSKEPPAHLKGLLKNNYAHYLGGCDFDEAMMTLAKGVGQWPPQFVTNPPFHLLEELREVADFPISKGHPEDLLGPLRERLQEVGTGWESGQTYEAQVNQSVIKGEAAEEPEEGGMLSDADKKALARSHLVQAVSTWVSSMGLSTPDLKAAHEKAVANYARAVELDPEYHEALNNWGIALYEEAMGLSGSARSEKFAGAGEKYAAALEIKPDCHEALNNWGTALLEEAKGLSGSARSEKFAAAGKKYEAALEIKPDKHEALYNLACLKALQGDTYQAIDALEIALATNSSTTAQELREDPDLELIRSHPRFPAVLAALEAK
ncbi:MAG: SIR2 family protein [Pseudomonadota bacterium]